jgi:hypothetical protein
MTGEYVRIWKKAVWDSFGEAEKAQEKHLPPVTTAVDPAEIRTEYTSSTCPQRHRYPKPSVSSDQGTN